MDKKQQIEQMAHLFCEYFKNDICKVKLKECDIDCGFAMTAEKIYTAGYRKIDYDCAVITKAELKQYKAQAVKEFAEKVEQAIVDNTYPYFDKNGKPVNIWNTEGFDKIDKLLKE